MTAEPQPRPASSIAGRTAPHRAAGLVLTVELAVLVALGAAFAALTEDALTPTELVGIDGPIARFIIDRRADALTPVMKAITSLGTGWVLAPVGLLVGVLAARRLHSRRPVVFLAVALIGSTLMATLIKVIVARPRPAGGLVKTLGYAFPSGHSTAAAAGWLALALVASWLTRRAALRAAAVVVAVVVVVLVGISRIYLGVHAPTDVLGGWALGAAWVAATAAAFRVYDSRRARSVG